MERTEFELKPFHSTADAGWDEIMAIYAQSFPLPEQWPVEGYRAGVGRPAVPGRRHLGRWPACRPAFPLARPCLPLSRTSGRIARHAGRDLGSKVLRAFCREAGRVVLEIDPPEDEISIRRQGFYERNGFVTNPYLYIHPSFRRPFQPHRLVLMSYPGTARSPGGGRIRGLRTS